MHSDPATTTRPTIRYRPGVPRPARRKVTRSNETDKARFTVTSDWPDPMPATGGEAGVIETFLSHLLDDLLARCASGPHGRHS
ncbi:hypothetical protein [Mesorhizobium sp. KR1-2]|uniref:hypothetical protein n=1 Tax=Mesorhizobium sp. KR1-2 TaxID=3156609 RepID=UPI0032B4C8C9